MATLITGLGYIGAALARRLLAEGEHVVAVENYFSTPRTTWRDTSSIRRTGEQRGDLRSPTRTAESAEVKGIPLTLIEGSVTDPATVERAFAAAPIDTVFHLAGQASADSRAASLAYTQETNYRGPLVLLEACAHHAVRVVLASSTRLYAIPLPRSVTEASPIGPTDLVHLSHRYGELLLEELRRRQEEASPAAEIGRPVFSGVAARIGIVHGVGPVMKTDLRFLAVPQRFCLQAARGEPLRAATGPHSVHAYIHIDDAVDGLLRCRQLPPGLDVVNVATEVRSVADVARVVQVEGRRRRLHVPIAFTGRPRPYGARAITSRLDASGFAPARRLEDSLGDVLDHYLAAGEA